MKQHNIRNAKENIIFFQSQFDRHSLTFHLAAEMTCQKNRM